VENANETPPMTGPQRLYRRTLCRNAGKEFNDQPTKAEVSKKIEDLQKKNRTRQISFDVAAALYCRVSPRLMLYRRS